MIVQAQSPCKACGRPFQVPKHLASKQRCCSHQCDVAYRKKIGKPFGNPKGRVPKTNSCEHADRKHYALGLCRACYDKALHEANPGLRSIRNKKRYAANPNVWKDGARRRIANQPIKYALSLAKASAKTRGLEMTLTEEYVCSIWTDTCPILGIPLRRVKGSRDSSPSIDRIDSSKGYVPGNVHVISFRANRIKNDASVEELEAIAAYLRGLVSKP